MYFHVPFCKKKCPYCHFYSILDQEESKDSLLEAFLQEIQFYAPLIQNHEILSIYFGGGTPYLFGAKRIETVLHALQQFAFPSYVECTLEANPEHVTEDELQHLFQAGVNRLSYGVQSFHQKDLDNLGRRCDLKTLAQAIKYATSAGFTNISLDLMYDLFEQTIDSWKQSLEQAISFPITHLSLYNLTIEPHTVFWRKKDALVSRMPTAEQSTKLFETAQEFLAAKKFYQYEISAFAQETYRSIHNIGYWTGRPYLGFGPSASSFYKGIRFANVFDLKKYLYNMRDEKILLEYRDECPKDERLKELIAVGLRYLDGVHLPHLEKITGSTLSSSTKQVLAELEQNELLWINHSKIQLTKRGLLMYDTVASEII